LSIKKRKKNKCRKAALIFGKEISKLYKKKRKNNFKHL